MIITMYLIKKNSEKYHPKNTCEIVNKTKINLTHLLNMSNKEVLML